MESYDSLLVQAASTMKQMSQLASQPCQKQDSGPDEVDTFCNFINNELRGIR